MVSRKDPRNYVVSLIRSAQKIPDSSAICGYLEKRFPEPGLYPSDHGDYGRALWYEDWADNELPKATAALFFNRIAVRMMKREPDEDVISKIITEIQPATINQRHGEGTR